jgi:hypothetical protein
VQHPTWILAFGLALLGAPASAVPCGDDSCREQKDCGDSSIQLKPTQPRDRSYDASRSLGDEFAPGLRQKGERPPGFRDNGRAREWRKRVATLPVIPTQEPGNASMPIPESTDLVLFGGLLLVQAAVRRLRKLGGTHRARRVERA